MNVELVKVNTSDAVRLDGLLYSPAPEVIADESPFDAAIFVHGTGSNFYGSSMGECLREVFLKLGNAFLSINTRGHDLISTASTMIGGRRAGAAYENVDECRYDLTAWIEWLARRGFQRQLLIGHSLGAVKCIYKLARDQPSAVVGLIALSPPRLSYASFMASPRADEFQETYRKAQQLVESGHGSTLIEPTVPMPYFVTAEGFLDKYGPDERYNILRDVDRLSCPTLFVFGGGEVTENVAFRELPEQIEERSTAATNKVKVAVIAGGDHFYSGVRSELSSRVRRWIRGLGPQ